MGLKIKVCGMKFEQNIKELALLSPDYMGFIFYPPSKRFVGVEFEKNFLITIPTQTHQTCVFVNATVNEVIEFAGFYEFKTIQLHGDETPAYCLELKQKGFKIIKAFGLDERFNFLKLTDYQHHVDYFLFDTASIHYGGSGHTFDWNLLKNYGLQIPFFLSGGISLENLSIIKNLKLPHLFAVDLNSKFELEPGLKNISELQKAFQIIRS